MLVSAFDTVVASRKTIRAFRPDSVPRQVVADILDIAAKAPSTFNTQPWRTHVVTGAAKAALTAAILAENAARTQPAFSPFPNPPPIDCAARQEDFGRRYYGALGIERSDMPARARQTARNYQFFDAPVGLILTTDARLTKHSWVDVGLFLQTLLLASQARGVSTCPQVSFVRYERVIARQLGLDDFESVVCGVSMGYADERAPVNQLDMPRHPHDAFTRWHDEDPASLGDGAAR